MSEQALIRFFKIMNPLMLGMWRLGLGRMINIWPAVIGRMMVITHTGRVTGLKRQTPVNYTIVDGELYGMAGQGVKADWYRNLMSCPQAAVWLPDGRWEACAEDVTARPDALRLWRAALKDSGFAAPVFGGINPYTIADEALAEKVKDYRLIHFQRVSKVEAR